MRFFFLFFVCTVFCNTAQTRVVRTSLIQAVQGDRMALLVQLVKGGVDVNVTNAIGRTAAHYAVLRDNPSALELLLNNGADPNLTDNEGRALLDLWHEHKNEKMLALLHAAGAKPAPPVHENEAMLALLHAAGAKPAPTAVEEQQSVISRVVDTEPVLDNKVESQDLWQAAANNDRASAERLLAEGADAKAKNAAGNTAFDVAVESGHDALAAILLKAVAGINGRDGRGWTPLHWAIVADDWDLVRELIEAGADISLGSQQNALEIAKLMNSETKLIEVFIDAKGVDAIVRDGRTVLIYAAWNGSTEVVKTLIEIGANINIQNDNGDTALRLAARRGLTEIVKILVENGADMNIKDSRYGRTALIYAAREGRTEVVKLLIDNGANMNIKDSRYGRTALDMAEGRGHTEIINILRAAQSGGT